MRLRRLDLTRYGKFTDHVLDFSPQPAGGPDLHVIYGPNEAGKSTTLHAWLDLLFGFGTGRQRHHPYAFQHGPDAIRIGASLEHAGQRHAFIRVRRGLLDEAGRPVGEPLLSGMLGGIDRDSYRAMFSLDDDTLEQGGEAILRSQGKLGELLFSGSAGIADLSRRLEELRAEANGFYQKHARRTQLSELKERLEGLDEERRRKDTLASAYARLIQERDRAQEDYARADEARRQAQRQRDDARKRLTAFPRLMEWRRIGGLLAPLADCPDAPPGWKQRAERLHDAETGVAHRLRAKQDIIRQESEALETLAIDQPALDLAEELDGLKDLESRFRTATDIVLRQRELQEEADRIAGALLRLRRPGEPNPERLLLDEAHAARLGTLVAQWSGLASSLRSAEEEAAAAAADHDAARAGLIAMGADPDRSPPSDASLVRLNEMIGRAEGDQSAARLLSAGRRRSELAVRLERHRAALLPWQGGFTALAALAAPGVEDFDDWVQALREAREACEQAGRTHEEAGEKVQRLRDTCGAIRAEYGIVDDEEASAVRAARDAAWRRHRAALTGETADAFETALRRDDAVTEAGLRNQAQIARLRETMAMLRVEEKAEARSALDRQQKLVRLQAAEQRIADAIRGFLPAGFPAHRARAWLVERLAALDTWAEEEAAERDGREARTDHDAIRDQLARALRDAGGAPAPGEDLAGLLAEAKARRDRVTHLAQLWKTVREAASARARREENRDKAAREVASWNERWRDACRSCWLRELGTSPLPEEVNAILAALPALATPLASHRRLAERIRLMEQDKADFAGAVSRLAMSLGMAAGGDPLSVHAGIADRVANARATARDRASRADVLETARRDLDELTGECERLARERGEMAACLGVDTSRQIADRLAEAERKRDLQAQRAVAEADLLRMLDVATVADAEAALEGVTESLLQAELSGLDARLGTLNADCERRYHDCHAAMKRVEDVGGDDAVARLDEQRRTVRLQIEEGALRYLRLRAGIAAAEHALTAYRQQHRNSMLSRASEAFRAVTRGAYSGLTSQPNRGGEDLLAVTAAGGTREVTQLSKGTRFQLYLALRIAGYHEFARTGAPVPFVADDIMETFDDLRAAETFRLLAGMAVDGQVICLTHHRHLCEIASRVCPAVRLHDLTG